MELVEEEDDYWKEGGGEVLSVGLDVVEWWVERKGDDDEWRR